MTKTEELLARQERYKKTERTTDSYGRVIGVRLLKTSEQIKVEEMAPALTGFDEVEDAKGEIFRFPKIMRLAIVAAVNEIDGAPYPFPKNRAELDARIDALDNAGIAAAMEGVTKLNLGDKADNETAPKVEDTAKNS